MKKTNIDPGVKELPEFDVIEQRSDYIKSRAEYSNGFIMINEIDKGTVTVKANYHWIQKPDGTLTPDFNNPNHDFVDVK
ncbi:hypothetical protein [Oceanobacillus alkalisoli]|uniref:hypothetical protein n=1 Tax=Oceanobacillus alkalisoli TaxID=2925113 RepID=UPI001F122195|nr:hypothetical protein [Oceanobacillus alkalisoli]MCF3942216.1 hypothetical protein [Oceanobacillus alkalisoli]